MEPPVTPSPSSPSAAPTDVAVNGPIYRVLTVWILAGLTIWAPLWLVYLQDRGLDLVTIGLLEAAGLLLQLSMSLPAGLMIDRFGRRTCLVAGCLTAALGVALLGSEVGSATFFIGFVLQKTSYLFINGSVGPTVYETLARSGREGEYTKWNGSFSAALEGAGIVCALLASALAAAAALEWAFVLSAGLLVIAAIVARTLDEPRVHTQATRPPSMGRVFRRAIHTVRTSPRVRYPAMLAAIASSGSYLILWIMVQPFGTAVGVPIAVIGLLAAAIRFSNVVAALTAHALVRRHGHRRVIAVGVTAVVLSTLPPIVFPYPWVMPFLIVGGIGRGFVGPTISRELNRHLRPMERATVLALTSTSALLILTVAQPLALGVLGAAGPSAGLLLVVAPYGIAATTVLWRWGRLPDRDGPDPARP